MLTQMNNIIVPINYCILNFVEWLIFLYNDGLDILANTVVILVHSNMKIEESISRIVQQQWCASQHTRRPGWGW